MRISLILWEIDGVSGVDVNYITHKVRVTFDPEKTSVEEMIKAIERDKGYEVIGKPKFLD